MFEELFQQDRMGSAFGGPFAIHVIISSPVCKRPDYTVDHHIARARIKRKYIVNRARGREVSQIGNAANILDDSAFRTAREQQPVRIRNQRRTLPTRSDVRSAKVRNDL